ncbi:MAG: queuosine salvage family protein, partial [Minisyncoccia bacterium]
KYKNSPEKFVLKLSELPQYKDIYPKYQIHFYKKAQLLYWELYLYGFIKNAKKLAHLTIFPDYSIIAFFNYLGLIIYNKELKNKIYKGQEIKFASRQEIELRAGAILAGEWLASKLNILPCKLDLVFWNIAHNLNLKKHKTKTIFY